MTEQARAIGTELEAHDLEQAPEPEPHLVSRRRFLRSAGLMCAGAAIGGAALALAGGGLFDAVRSTRPFTDDRGRTVDIPTPSHLQRVYFSGPIGQIMMFAVKPELIAGTTLPFTQQELAFLPNGTSKLPFMGSLSEGVDLDVGALREEDVQLVISAVGDNREIEALQGPDQFTEESGIPVVYLDAGFETMGDAFRKLGDIVGAEARAEEVARFCERIYAEVTDAVAQVPTERRRRLYYAEGPEGLQTEPFNSAHAYTFSVAGAYNVAEVDVLDAHGKTRVTIDEVRAWDPDVIIAWDQEIRDGASKRITTDPDWKGISAVDEGRVYAMPNVPFSWCDRPTGPNRCIGIQWVANLLYPDYYPIDMVDATREFYEVMWRISITEELAINILGHSYTSKWAK